MESSLIGRSVAARLSGARFRKLRKLRRNPREYLLDTLVNRRLDGLLSQPIREWLANDGQLAKGGRTGGSDVAQREEPAGAPISLSASEVSSAQSTFSLVVRESATGVSGYAQIARPSGSGLSWPEFIGFSAANAARLANRASWITLSVADPVVRSCPNAIVPKAVRATPTSRYFFGGVVDENGESVPGSHVVRGVRDGELFVGPMPGHTAIAEVTDKRKVIFGGFGLNHFGHILLETLSRLWLRDLHRRRLPIVVQTTSGRLPSLVGKMFELAGVADRICPMNRSTRFARVIVPAPAFVLRQHAHVALKALYLRMAERTLKGSPITLTEQPLYLSRSRVSHERRAVFGEERLEEVLQRNGVRIVHPQELSFAEQIRLVSSHRTIIGPIGSAFHLLLFSMISNRAIYLTSDIPTSSYIICDALNATRATYVRTTAVDAPISTRELNRTRLPQLLDVEGAVGALRDLGLITSADVSRDTTPNLERAYRRQFLRIALVDATQRALGRVVAEAEIIVEREFGDDAALMATLNAARQACRAASTNASAT